MIARYTPGLVAGLIAVVAGATPALAQIRIDQSEVSGGVLMVAGQVSPPSMVTVGVGPTSIIITPDPTGRFVWIGDQVPPSCMVTVSRGIDRARAGIASCGVNPPPSQMVAYSSTTTTYGSPIYGSTGGWRSDQPAPGIGGVSQTTTTTTTTTRRDPPWMISPNDPRYGQTEPPHWGQPEVQGQRSGEVMYTYPGERGFYANVRSKEGG